MLVPWSSGSFPVYLLIDLLMDSYTGYGYSSWISCPSSMPPSCLSMSVILCFSVSIRCLHHSLHSTASAFQIKNRDRGRSCRIQSRTPPSCPSTPRLSPSLPCRHSEDPLSGQSADASLPHSARQGSVIIFTLFNRLYAWGNQGVQYCSAMTDSLFICIFITSRVWAKHWMMLIPYH